MRGKLHFYKNEYMEAEKWYLEHNSILAKVRGEDNMDFACSLFVLGQLYNTMGQFEKAEIKVHYDTHRVGPFSKSVTVNSNAKNSPVVLRISGTVEAPATVPTASEPSTIIPTPAPTTAATTATSTPIVKSKTAATTTTAKKTTTKAKTTAKAPVKKTTTTTKKTTTVKK